MSWTWVIIIAAMLVVLVVYSSLSTGKKKWYKVFLTNNDVMLLYRDFSERWWRTNDRYLRFKNEEGKEVSFLDDGRWILFMEEAKDLAVAREEIKKIKEANAKAMGV